MFTIKRQNLSGAWFDSQSFDEREAKILFDYYCRGPFQTVELWEEGNQWYRVYNKVLCKSFECFN